MTLPATPPIKASDINVELGRSAGAAFDINGTEERALAGVPSGAISFSDFLGKSARSVTQLYASSGVGTSFGSVPLGAADANRRIVVLAWHGTRDSDPGTAPTCTIGGNGQTLIKATTTGQGPVPHRAIGTAMWAGNPSGTSATVAVNWGSLPVAIVVLKLLGFQSTPTASGGETSAADDGQVTINTALNGCVIWAGGAGDDQSSQTWTNVTKRGQDNVVSNDGGLNEPSRGWAWDINTDGSSHTYRLQPWSNPLFGGYAMVGASFPII